MHTEMGGGDIQLATTIFWATRHQIEKPGDPTGKWATDIGRDPNYMDRLFGPRIDLVPSHRGGILRAVRNPAATGRILVANEDMVWQMLKSLIRL